MNREQVIADATLVAESGVAALHDLTGQMDRRGIPLQHRAIWLNTIEDVLDVLDMPEQDETCMAEDRALAGAYAS